MPTATLPAPTSELADEIVAGWLDDTPVDGWDNPAGPLFSSGKFAPQEITMTGGTNSNCSLCTGSWPLIECC